MALLGVNFKSNTAREWIVERMKAIGIEESPDGLKSDSNSEFMLIAYPAGFYGLVQVSDDNEIRMSRAIWLISPQVKDVYRILGN